MRVVTPKQMGKIEDRSEKLGVSKRQLMLNAGKRLAERIDTYCRQEIQLPPEATNITFLIGTGNNGGDCSAAADLLVYKGYSLTVVTLCGEPKTDLAKEMLSRLPDRVNIISGYRDDSTNAAIEAAELSYMTVQESEISELKKKKELSPIEKILLAEKERMAAVRSAVVSADVLVDGVFGTGFKGKLSKDIMAVFGIGTAAYKIAADVPSGGNCTNGTVSAGTFKADETITFGWQKTGMTQYPLKKLCGSISVADIGIPPAALSAVEGERQYHRIDRFEISGFPPKRERDAHKGLFGRLLIIAGSDSMRGAAAFAALGALRAGAGAVKLASVPRCIDTAAVLAPEATFLELADDDKGFMLFESNTNALKEAISSSDTVVIGCGMGVTNDTVQLTKFVVRTAQECGAATVIDADGINCIARDIDILQNITKDVIITPHPGEMARLLSCESSMINDNRIVVAEKYAEKFGITVVLKGAGTLICNDRITAANHTGNAGMARGGSGDILAGIIGAVSAQGYLPHEAACAGVYLHGLAGDAAAEKLGMEGMLPRDIIDSIPRAFNMIKEKLNAQ
ncbi:MAG TPA: NAD(P)H-hydrate dehydratase [Ruminococcus sp.]|nr:NAD(P)H-hydrate dehydratase [Ruminococcus sp.]